MYDIQQNKSAIIKVGETHMGNIISLLQEIFMLKENTSVRVGLSEFKGETVTPVEKPKKKIPAPKELKLSDLMRKGSY